MDYTSILGNENMALTGFTRLLQQDTLISAQTRLYKDMNRIF